MLTSHLFPPLKLKIMTAEKTFYDFNLNSLQERQERNSLFPELARFHIALREELREDEYQDFFNAEKESYQQALAYNETFNLAWAEA
jgi:hypothetical protein